MKKRLEYFSKAKHAIIRKYYTIQLCDYRLPFLEEETFMKLVDALFYYFFHVRVILISYDKITNLKTVYRHAWLKRSYQNGKIKGLIFNQTDSKSTSNSTCTWNWRAICIIAVTYSSFNYHKTVHLRNRTALEDYFNVFTGVRLLVDLYY